MRLKITLHEEREELDRMEARKWWGKNQIQAKMSDNEVNGPEDAVVSKMIKQLPKRTYTSSRSAFRNASWARWKHQVRGEIVKLVFFWKTRCGTEEGNQKLQGHCAVCFSSFGNREWTWELEEFTRGRNWRHQLPTLSSHDDKFVAETLRVAGGQKTKDEARQCETTHDILGEHGHQDGFSTWRDRSTLHELWRITIVNVIASQGYECYTSVTCSTWSELGSTDTENGTRVNKTVGLWMERVQTGWLLFVMAQQQGSQHCLRNRNWLQWYQKAERVTKLHKMCTRQKKHWSLRLVLEADGWMTWQGLQSEKQWFHVKSRLASVSQISTFRPHELAKKKEQLYKVSSPCLDDHQFKKEELESVGEIVRSLLTNCLDVLVLGTNWTTRHSARSGQKRLRHVTDDEQGRFLTFITPTISDNVVMWETRLSIVDWVFMSRLRLCWRPWGLEINLWEILMHRRKSNICHHQLDGQEANTSIQQFYGVWNHFIGCWIAHGWNTCSWSLGRGNWNVTFNQRHCKTK